MPTLDIFISFRSADTADFKDELVKFLEKSFPDVRVKTSSDLVSGDWLKQIFGFIDRAKIMIVLAGMKWERGDGTKDITLEKDVVRQEVSHGLRRRAHGLHIITILVQREKLHKELLPSELLPLLDIHWRKGSSEDINNGLLKVATDIYQQLERYRPKPVALISSTLAILGDGLSQEGLDYFTILVMTIIQRLKSHGCDVILKVPIYAEGNSAAPDAAENQRVLLEETVQHAADYSGIIVSPFDLDCLKDTVRRLLIENPSYPIATVDKSYDPKDSFFHESGVKPPAGFVCDGHYNGRLAADCILRYLLKASVKKPNVVLVQGLQGSAERIEGFLSRIREFNAGRSGASYVNVYVSGKTDFIEEQGKLRAKAFLSDQSSWLHLLDEHYMPTISNQKRKAPLKVAAFFCCNDELALGAVDYLEQLRVSGRPEDAVVIGFDGISATRLLVKENNQWLLNSVNVRLSEQVNQLVRNFVQALREKSSVAPGESTKGALVEPYYDGHIEQILNRRNVN